MQRTGATRFKRIILQFRVPALSSLPPLTQRLEHRFVPRTVAPLGQPILSSTPDTSLLAFLADLTAARYWLVDMVCKIYEDLEGRGNYYITRFIFSNIEKPTDNFKKIRRIMRNELKHFCTDTLWRVAAFSNPIKRGRSAHIYLNSRTPLLRKDGSPVGRLPINATGEPVGDTPIPRTAAYHLRFIPNAGGIHLPRA